MLDMSINISLLIHRTIVDMKGKKKKTAKKKGEKNNCLKHFHFERHIRKNITYQILNWNCYVHSIPK